MSNIDTSSSVTTNTQRQIAAETPNSTQIAPNAENIELSSRQQQALRTQELSASTNRLVSDSGESQEGNVSAELESDPEQLESAVSELNDYVQTLNRELRFSIDDDTGSSVVSVIDQSSDEVVRQIPTEEALELARRLEENQSVNLFEAKA